MAEWLLLVSLGKIVLYYSLGGLFQSRISLGSFCGLIFFFFFNVRAAFILDVCHLFFPWHMLVIIPLIGSVQGV